MTTAPHEKRGNLPIDLPFPTRGASEDRAWFRRKGGHPRNSVSWRRNCQYLNHVGARSLVPIAGVTAEGWYPLGKIEIHE